MLGNHYLLMKRKNAWKSRVVYWVTIGACEVAKVCELVGTFVLLFISEKYDKKNVGLYRDDGLGVIKNKRGRETENKEKHTKHI